MSDRPALVLASGLALVATAGLAYLGLAVVEQRRALADLGERQAADRAALSAELDRLRDRLGEARAEIDATRSGAKADSARIGALLHDLEARVEELRVRSEPLVADLPTLPVGAQ